MARADAEELSLHHRRIRERGINPWVYWPVRAFLQPFLMLFFRMRRGGRAHVPRGRVLLAANHRSFLDLQWAWLGGPMPQPAEREPWRERAAA